MRIGFVSRWGVRCGVSTYTDQLVGAMVQQGTEVFCVAETVGGLASVPDWFEASISCAAGTART